MSGQRYAKDVANVWVKFLPCGGRDSDELVRVGAIAFTKVFPGLWENWGDGGELRLWRRGASLNSAAS